MIQSGSRLCIMAHNEFTTDLPEFARLGERAACTASRNCRQGLLGRPRPRHWAAARTIRFAPAREENVLGYPGDPYAAECILIHEFAHNIHLRGMVNVDPTFDTRLKATYDAAMKAGLWKGKYAGTNHHEYFAEGVQSWFDNNRENDHDHNHVNTRARADRIRSRPRRDVPRSLRRHRAQIHQARDAPDRPHGGLRSGQSARRSRGRSG